jgi:hypothetical protein
MGPESAILGLDYDIDEIRRHLRERGEDPVKAVGQRQDLELAALGIEEYTAEFEATKRALVAVGQGEGAEPEGEGGRGDHYEKGRRGLLEAPPRA